MTQLASTPIAGPGAKRDYPTEELSRYVIGYGLGGWVTRDAMIIARDATPAVFEELRRREQEVRAGRLPPIPARDGSVPYVRRESKASFLAPIAAVLVVALVSAGVAELIGTQWSARSTASVSGTRSAPAESVLIPMVQRSVVTVVAEMPNGNSETAGSGFFVTTDGRFLTNAHVVQGAARVDAVTSDGQSHPAAKVAIDLPLDVAEFSINQTEVPLKLTTSKPYVGMPIYVLGNPLAQSPNSTAKGKVTGTNVAMRTTDGRPYPNMITTDASGDHGNSGGPVIDTYGDVIGIATLGDQRSGFSSAIPADRFAASVAGWAVVTPSPYPKPAPLPNLGQPGGSCTLTLCSGSISVSNGGGPGTIGVTFRFMIGSGATFATCSASGVVGRAQTVELGCSSAGDYRAIGGQTYYIQALLTSAQPD